MKIKSLLILTLLANLGCVAAVPLKWTVESSHAEPVYFNVYRGETLELEATFNSYGRPLTNGLNAAQIFWQTNGMESAWWYDDATVDGNRIRATFTPEMYPDATTVRVFLGVTNSIYRADATLRIRHSPANPNHLYPPIPVLDFNQVEVHNAPWQRPLIPGDNIVITNDVISALGGGGGGVTPDDLAAVAVAATNYTDNAAQAATNYTDAAVADLPRASDLAAVAEAATNYTDNAAQAATNYTDNAAQAATNYTDAAVSGLPTATDLAAVAEAATNYTDNAAQAATNYTDAAVSGLPTATDLAAVAEAATNYTDNAAQAATNYTDAATQNVVRLDRGSIIMRGIDDQYTGLILCQDETNHTTYSHGVITITSPDVSYMGETHTGSKHTYILERVWDGDVMDTVATKRESYQRVNDKDGGSTALVLHENNPQYGGPYGAYSISGDEASRAGGYGSVALGYHTSAQKDYTVAIGQESVALQEGAIALGYQCFNQATNAFGWSAAGAYNLNAARSGTFNINPIGGAAGFYIGSTNLATLLSQSSGTSESRVREIIAEEGSVKTNAAGVATFANVYPHSTNTITTAINGRGVEVKYNGDVMGLNDYGVYYENADGGLTLNLVSKAFLETDVDGGVTNEYALYLPWLNNNETIATREWATNAVSGKYLALNRVTSSGTTKDFIRYGSRVSSSYSQVGDYSVTFGQRLTAKGARSFAANADNAATGNDSAAFGGDNTAANTYAFVVGETNVASGRASFVAGGKAKTESAHAYAFAWNGDTNVLYSSKAKGTFNVNPIGGTDGFYVGATNLTTLLAQSAGMPDVSCTVPGIKAIKSSVNNNRLEISKETIPTLVTTNSAIAYYAGMSVRKFTTTPTINMTAWPDGEACFVILDLPATAMAPISNFILTDPSYTMTGRVHTAIYRVGNNLFCSPICTNVGRTNAEM